MVDCTPTGWLQQHLWSHLFFQNLATWPSRGRGSDPSPWTWWGFVSASTHRRYVASEARSPKAIQLPSGSLSWGVQPAVRKPRPRGQVIGGITKGQASGQLQQPAGTWVIIEIRRSPQLTRPRWCWVRLRWGSCPHCRYGREERLLLFHTTKFCGGFLKSNRFLKWTVRNYNEEQMNDNIKFRIMVTDGERVADCDGLGAVGSTSGWAYSDRWWKHRPSYSSASAVLRVSSSSQR